MRKIKNLQPVYRPSMPYGSLSSEIELYQLSDKNELIKCEYELLWSIPEVADSRSQQALQQEFLDASD